MQTCILVVCVENYLVRVHACTYKVGIESSVASREQGAETREQRAESREEQRAESREEQRGADSREEMRELGCANISHHTYLRAAPAAVATRANSAATRAALTALVCVEAS